MLTKIYEKNEYSTFVLHNLGAVYLRNFFKEFPLTTKYLIEHDIDYKFLLDSIELKDGQNHFDLEKIWKGYHNIYNWVITHSKENEKEIKNAFESLLISTYPITKEITSKISDNCKEILTNFFNTYNISFSKEINDKLKEFNSPHQLIDFANNNQNATDEEKLKFNKLLENESQILTYYNLLTLYGAEILMYVPDLLTYSMNDVIKNKDLSLCNLIVNACYNLLSEDSDWHSPLHRALIGDSPEVALVLINNFINYGDINHIIAKNKHGTSVLDLAKEKNYEEIIDVIKDYFKQEEDSDDLPPSGEINNANFE